jgi:hypothetical protein
MKPIHKMVYGKTINRGAARNRKSPFCNYCQSPEFIGKIQLTTPFLPSYVCVAIEIKNLKNLEI